MSYPLRWYLPNVTYECTIRTLDSRFLLRPDDASRAIIHSVIARAARRYPNVRLHNYDAQINHLHVDLSSTDGESIPRFLQYVHGNLARELSRLRGWVGKFWGRRVRVIPIVDDDAIVARFRYILAQGVKSGLVASPRDWPGACAVGALLGSMRVTGTWISRQRLWRNAHRAAPQPVESLVETVEAPLHPIPPWQHLSHDELVARHAAMVDDLEREHAGRPVLGVDRLTTQDPLTIPTHTAHRPAPACHASTATSRDRFRAAFRAFRDAFSAATATLRRLTSDRPAAAPSTAVATPSIASPLVDVAGGGIIVVPPGAPPLPRPIAAFPIGSCPRPGGFVRPPSTAWVMWPPWTEPIAAAA